MLMPPLTYIHASEAARTTAGGRVAEAMQKVCETIGLFNAEYLAVSDISINTHTHTHTISATGADYIINIRADARKYTAFFAFLQGRPHCFFPHSAGRGGGMQN